MSVATVFFALIPLMVSSAQSKTDIFLVGSIDGQTPRQETVFLLNKDARLVLSVVLMEHGHLYSSVDSFEAQGGRRPVENRLRPHLGISWYQVRPRLKEYSNLWRRGHPDIGDIHLEPIEYERVPIAGCQGQDSIDLSSAISPHETGTFYLGVDIGDIPRTLPPRVEGLAESSPLFLKYRYRIVQVVRRKDDSYLGYLTELCGTPFIIGPRMTDQGVHETDARMGSDCAAFAIYGKRRQGHRVPYCGPLGIYRYLSPIESAPLKPGPFEKSGVYVTRNHRVVRTGLGGLRPGDIVHFGEQVSVFYGDAGIKGVFDKDDLLFQCFGSCPAITTVEKSGFYHLPVRIYRWRDDVASAELAAQDSGPFNWDRALADLGLVDVRANCPDILVRLKYATEDNFLQKNVYGLLRTCYLVKEAASKLADAQKTLAALKRGWRLEVFDGARPRRIQAAMWELVKGTPQQSFVANPSTGSNHNYGAAVDLTIVDELGQELDMGTPFDFFGELAEPRLEDKFLKRGMLTPHQVQNRRLLRQVMTEAGFIPIAGEWWHFDAFPTAEIRKRFKAIE